MKYINNFKILSKILKINLLKQLNKYAFYCFLLLLYIIDNYEL